MIPTELRKTFLVLEKKFILPLFVLSYWQKVKIRFWLFIVLGKAAILNNMSFDL